MAYTDEDFLFTQSWVCLAAGVASSSYRNWQIPVKQKVGRGGKVDIRDVFQYLRTRRRPQAALMESGGKGDDPTSFTPKERSDLALAKRREAELALLEKTLVTADQVQAAWESQMVAIKQALLTMPTRLARIYNTVDDAKQFKAEAMDECRSALENLASLNIFELDDVDLETED